MVTANKKGEWCEFIVPKEWAGFTPEQLLREIWKASKKQTHQLRMQKDLVVNGQPANWVSPLHENDRLLIKLFTETDFGVIPTFKELDILYEDDHVMVINKPPGIDTHPNSPDQANTLANAVAFYLLTKGEYCPVKHVHRLDRDTSGAILFAKHSFIGSILDKMLEERLIKRTYLALVQGVVKQKKGTINAPIGRDRHHPTRRRVSPNGQSAVTHYEVIKVDPNKNRTLVQCQLDTGRTHQIRVHFSHIGHPLIGDTLYGGKPDFDRQALHALRLEFTHPLTLERIICESDRYLDFL
jgi:23S rRNA pseudouridine1911/1915/1917 synthase